MKKVLAILLALAFASILLSGCPGKGGGGGGSDWIGAGVARSVDKQFGPVTVGTSQDGPTLAAEGAGSHEATQLGGKVSAATIKTAVQFAMESWLPTNSLPLPTVPVPGPFGGKHHLAALVSAVSVDNNPCKQDGDNDGTPDVNEDLCDPVTDEQCFGLCVGGTAVECRANEGSFTIKFTDCQINITNWEWNWNATPWLLWTTLMPSYVTTAWWSGGSTGTDNTTAWASTSFCTNTTVNGTVDKILAWNTGTPGTVNGVAHSRVDADPTTLTFPNLCGFWNPTSSVLQGTAFSDEVQCVRGKWYDVNPNTGHAFLDHYRYFPYSPLLTGTVLGSPFEPVQIKINGSITLALGAGGVDEQLVHTRYNNLSQVWSTDGQGMETNPYAIFNGQALDYRVLQPDGQPAWGTTWGGLRKGPPIDSEWFGHQVGMDQMLIISRQVKMDMDGENGTDFEPGQYNYRGGFDNEDLFFIFTEGNNLVSVNDKNGSFVLYRDWPNLSLARGMGGWRLVGATAEGNPIYALSFYEKDNGEDDKCMIPQNKTPCRINVEVDPKLRTFDVLSIADCQALDTANIPGLTDVAF